MSRTVPQHRCPRCSCCPRSPRIRPKRAAPWAHGLLACTLLALATPLALGENLPQGPAPLGRIELELALERAEADAEAAQAASLAREWLGAVEAEFGTASPEHIAALTRAGRAHRLAEVFDDAERLLRDALALDREANGPLSPAQLAPLTELGRLYQAIEEHPLALATFAEAQGLSRRTLGLLNLAQLEMLDGMAESLLAMEAYDEAESRQREAFDIAERHHGPETLALLPRLYEFAFWLRRTGRLGEERALYMRAIRMLEADGGPEDPRLIDPLRRLAKSHQYAASFIEPRGMAGGPTGYPSADQALGRALTLAREMAEPRPALEALILLDQGDWRMASGRRSAALEHYREAWQRLEEAEDGPRLRQSWFGTPAAVTSPQPSWRGVRPRGSEPGLEHGQVIATYTVNVDGRAENIEIVESFPPGRKDTTVRRTLRETRFRPRFEDGEPVASDNQRYSFLFGFRP